MKKESYEAPLPETERLPREVQPSRDLWPDIEARLAPRASAPVASFVEAASRKRGWSRREWGLQALAALFFMALGASLTYWSAGPGTGPAGSVLVRAGAGPAPGVVPASDAAGDAGTELDRIEADYLQARDALWLHTLRHRESFPPGTLDVVEKNLELLELAIRDLRRALELDPGNPDLERRWRHSHQRSIDLLQHLAREA